ncbi:MAG: hypothetical protein P8X52_04495, partial [Limibacillus sp.]
MLPVAEARARILEAFSPLAPETLSLAQAGGRVLAEDLASHRTQPPKDMSAMDGFAVRAQDTFGASEEHGLPTHAQGSLESAPGPDLHRVRQANRPARPRGDILAEPVPVSATSPAAVVADAGKERVSHSSHFMGDGRGNTRAVRESRDEYQPLEAGAERREKTGNDRRSATSFDYSASPNADFWFYLADVELYGDSDRD